MNTEYLIFENIRSFIEQRLLILTGLVDSPNTPRDIVRVSNAMLIFLSLSGWMKSNPPAVGDIKFVTQDDFMNAKYSGELPAMLSNTVEICKRKTSYLKNTDFVWIMAAAESFVTYTNELIKFSDAIGLRRWMSKVVNVLTEATVFVCTQEKYRKILLDGGLDDNPAKFKLLSRLVYIERFSNQSQDHLEIAMFLTYSPKTRSFGGYNVVEKLMNGNIFIFRGTANSTNEELFDAAFNYIVSNINFDVKEFGFEFNSATPQRTYFDFYEALARAAGNIFRDRNVQRLSMYNPNDPDFNLITIGSNEDTPTYEALYEVAQNLGVEEVAVIDDLEEYLEHSDVGQLGANIRWINFVARVVRYVKRNQQNLTKKLNKVVDTVVSSFLLNNGEQKENDISEKEQVCDDITSLYGEMGFSSFFYDMQVSTGIEAALKNLARDIFRCESIFLIQELFFTNPSDYAYRPSSKSTNSGVLSGKENVAKAALSKMLWTERINLTVTRRWLKPEFDEHNINALTGSNVFYRKKANFGIFNPEFYLGQPEEAIKERMQNQEWRIGLLQELRLAFEKMENRKFISRNEDWFKPAHLRELSQLGLHYEIIDDAKRAVIQRYLETEVKSEQLANETKGKFIKLVIDQMDVTERAENVIEKMLEMVPENYEKLWSNTRVFLPINLEDTEKQESYSDLVRKYQNQTAPSLPSNSNNEDDQKNKKQRNAQKKKVSFFR